MSLKMNQAPKNDIMANCCKMDLLFNFQNKTGSEENRLRIRDKDKGRN